jgi:hypothetical protein
MEDKKPKVLDILRLIIAILTFAGAVLVGISLFIAVYDIFTTNHEDGFSGLIFIFIIPLMVGTIVYSIVGLKWIKKYNKIKNIPLIQRSVGVGESIVKIVVVGFFIGYLCIPFVVYWLFDLIEAIMRKKLAEKIRETKPEPEFKTNETHTIDDPNRCKYCGKEVDYRYARFCEHCGAEIEFRK